MEFRILGPVEAFDQGRSLPLGGAKPRAVLAVLLLHAHEVVSRDRLIEAVWSERAPPTAPKALQVHVSQLRKALPHGVLQSRSPGYVIEPAPGELDLERFEGLVAAGRAARAGGNLELASQRLGEALSLWRGPPLADLERFAQSEVARLEETRLAALEARIQSDLELGADADLVGELGSLVAEEPLHEHLRAQLMLALYRAGRQAEALEAYRDGRRALVEQLGVEPGRQLRDLERAILRQDARLDAHPRVGSGHSASSVSAGLLAGGGRPWHYSGMESG